MPRAKGINHIYVLDGKDYEFDRRAFIMVRDQLQEHITQQHRKGEKISLQELYTRISIQTEEEDLEKTISVDNLKNFATGTQTPKDEDDVQRLANAMTDLFDQTRHIRFVDLVRETTALLYRKRSRRVEYKIDWTDTHSVIRSIYLMISRYIDEFKRTVAFETCYETSVPDCPSLEDIEEAIYDGMLDMPKDTFESLLSFCRGYLKEMNYFDEGYDLIWDRTEAYPGFVTYTEYCEMGENDVLQQTFKAMESFDGTDEDYYLAMHNNIDDYPESEPSYQNYGYHYQDPCVEYVNYIAQKAYSMLEEILKEK